MTTEFPATPGAPQSKEWRLERRVAAQDRLLANYRSRYEDAERMAQRQGREIDDLGDEVEVLERALRSVIGDLLEAEGKPRTGPGADLMFGQAIESAKGGA